MLCFLAKEPEGEKKTISGVSLDWTGTNQAARAASQSAIAENLAVYSFRHEARVYQ